MASINKAIIVGNLGRDPETRYTADGGTAITSLSVATTRRYRNADGQTVSETEWHRIVLFSRLAEIAKDYLRKGSLVYIEGRIRTRRYQAKDGTDRYATEIIGETLQLLDRRQSDQQGMDDGFESAPRPAVRPNPAPVQQPAVQPAATAAPIDQLDEDVPF
ncbi:MAG: single-stranded DNA-binding protein [Sutterella sp.]|nr:single-stranded DNA-binding protein [Sutterella sp.]